MKTFVSIAACALLLGASGCAADSSRVTEYLSGFQAPSASVAPPIGKPLVAGLVLAVPEIELGKPTTPSPATLEKVAERVRKELQESSSITVERIFPPIIIPARGLHGLTLE